MEEISKIKDYFRLFWGYIVTDKDIEKIQSIGFNAFTSNFGVVENFIYDRTGKNKKQRLKEMYGSNDKPTT